MLRFQVQGSAKTPYRVSFEGEGRLLTAFCTCPAFARGGLFCKHGAALLMGDVTALVGDSSEMSELARRAVGSPLLERALQHQPAKPKIAPVSGFATIQEVARGYAQRFQAMGLTVELTEGGNDGAVFLRLSRIGGVKRKKLVPVVALSYEPWTYDLVIVESGDFEEVRRPSVKMWRLGIGRSSRAYTTLDRALVGFEEALAGAPA